MPTVPIERLQVGQLRAPTRDMQRLATSLATASLDKP